MAFPRGGLAQTLVDLLYELDGGPGGRGVTVDQLTNYVLKHPPSGLLYAAVHEYAIAVVSNQARGRGVGYHGIVNDDGAQGISILSDADGNAWFSKRQAVRSYLRRRLYNALRPSRTTGWVICEDGRWRITSADAGPRVPGIGIYNAAARAQADSTDQGHAAYVNAMSALEHIDEPVLAEMVLAASLQNGHRTREVYDRRRVDYMRMREALRKLQDPEQQRELRKALAERSVGEA